MNGNTVTQTKIITTKTTEEKTEIKTQTAHELDANPALYKDVLASLPDGHESIEQHLASKVGLYEGILDSLPIAIVVIDLEARLIFLNKPMEQFFGPHKLRTPIANIAPECGFYLPDQATLWPIEQLPLLRVSRTHTSNGGIMFVRNKFKPEGVWITNFAYPVKDIHNNKVIGSAAIVREIEYASERGLPTFGSAQVPPFPF
jgi:PAS domain-containing protein